MVSEYRQEFLWLPKRINGKWHWLEKVLVNIEFSHMIVDGEVRLVKHKVYIL